MDKKKTFWAVFSLLLAVLSVYTVFSRSGAEGSVRALRDVVARRPRGGAAIRP